MEEADGQALVGAVGCPVRFVGLAGGDIGQRTASRGQALGERFSFGEQARLQRGQLRARETTSGGSCLLRVHVTTSFAGGWMSHRRAGYTRRRSGRVHRRVWLVSNQGWTHLAHPPPSISPCDT